MIKGSVFLNEARNKLVILDQTLLPSQTVYLELDEIEVVWEAIRALRVRGAPAIGIAAASGIAVVCAKSAKQNYNEFLAEFKKNKEYLETSRPTAVNLFWALNRMEGVITENKDRSVIEIKSILLDEAEKIKDEDALVCKRIGEYGFGLLKDGWTVLTHCNAGSLATALYGTALAPVYIAKEKGFNIKVFADETRPLLQGARLTAYELIKSGVDITLICDNMAASVMEKNMVDIIFTGADRVAANGDSANKIGTLGLAVLASYYKIPFYICAPLSTIDISCKSGRDIIVEERPADEVTKMWYKKPMAPDEVKVYNPAFDVTPASLITGIITEVGILKPPFEKAIRKIF